MKLKSHFHHFQFPTHSSIVLGLMCDTVLLAITQLSPGMAVPTPDLHPEKMSSAIVPNLRVVVNSNQDGSIQPDSNLTLREAIQIVNGILPLNQLSAAEKAQVQSLSSETPSQIAFNLPQSATTIHLVEVLPPLASPGLIIDGTTQPGYNTTPSTTTEIAIPTPIVAITPAEQSEVFRGLTIVADGVTIRGLSLYGFTAKYQATASTPPADIFINASYSTVESAQQEQHFPPRNIVIEDNWLGVPPDGSMSSRTSAFGVSVFNSLGTTIRRNRIANHDGSGVITGVQAKNLQVTENLIIGNGKAGMPDAIRLEGQIDGTQIASNLIRDNDGSAIFLFKPEGSAVIRDNKIESNGRRLHRAAIYLMGNDHQVLENTITHQSGPGVVIASYPQSNRNIIQNNRFASLEGLSIDLNTQQNVGVRDYQIGDGPNPPRNSPNRRLETGNAAIDAPQFLSPEFLLRDGRVNLDGIANPGSIVEIYRVIEDGSLYGSLSESLAKVTTDDKGRFGVSLTNLQPGDKVSAIATDPQYGTSEPAQNAVVRLLN